MGMWRRLANLLRRERVDAEIEAELRAHILGSILRGDIWFRLIPKFPTTSKSSCYRCFVKLRINCG